MLRDPKVVEHLNIQLTNELTAINQYFLHARTLEHWGVTKLGKQEYAESIGEMKHADLLIQRILFLGGLPNVQRMNQVAVGETITTDLACAYPMHRLLPGEVGSGKTVIAIRAMLQVVDAGGQAALLAPTEVLAQQHYRSITAMLGPLALGRLALGGQLGAAEHATGVTLLTGSVGAAARRAVLAETAAPLLLPAASVAPDQCDSASRALSAVM